VIAPATDNAVATLGRGKDGMSKHGKVLAYTLSLAPPRFQPDEGGARSTSERHATIKMEKGKRYPRHKP
jgi:hypothetical protein